MGKFIGVIAAALEHQDGEFIQATELLDFLEETWVYYCRPHLGPPKPGWADLAAGTLRLSMDPPPIRHDQVEWLPLLTRDEATGAYEYISDVFDVEPGNNLFHLALPPLMLPDPASSDVPLLYGHADKSRFVLGWSIAWDQVAQGDHWPTIRFAPVNADAFGGQATDLERSIARQTRERARQMFSAWAPPGEPDRDVLLDRLDQGLDEEEVRTLAFELGVSFGNLAGETKVGKLRELLLYLDRQSQLPHLIRHLSKPKYGHILRRQ
ncbi:MAG: hypothetical protein R6X18_15640 [Chloroflexota bacterium]|jgi:hypothetical protein